MVKYVWMICWAAILWFAGIKTEAQVRTFNEGYDNYGPYYYRTAREWQYIREIMFHHTGLQDSLKLRTLGKTFQNVICPWWIEDLYRPGIFQGKFRRLSYVGYVLNPLTGLPALTNSWNASVLLDSAWQYVPVDLLVYCRGGDAFDYFLKSDSAKMNFIRAVFDPEQGLINKRHYGRRPAGLHFYLPDFSFREKRAFIQFVRSVSMVIDHFCQKGIRPYEGEQCWLTFTFSPSAKTELNYLSGVIGLVDEVHFAVYDEFGIPLVSPEIYTDDNDPVSVLYQSLNQFYLFSLSRTGKSVETGCCDDLAQLARAEYSGHNWRLYFFTDVMLIVGILILVISYNLSSPFYMFVRRYEWTIVPVMITLLTEVIIIGMYMIEALSKTQLFFDLDRNTHLFLLILPVLFILIYFGLKISGSNKQLP